MPSFVAFKRCSAYFYNVTFIFTACCDAIRTTMTFNISATTRGFILKLIIKFLYTVRLFILINFRKYELFNLINLSIPTAQTNEINNRLKY